MSCGTSYLADESCWVQAYLLMTEDSQNLGLTKSFHLKIMLKLLD